MNINNTLHGKEMITRGRFQLQLKHENKLLLSINTI